jgi:catechol 2,3-dioxygenase-like lactoylglutathione lyase family enzyme
VSASPISKVDTIGVPSRDTQRSVRFYVETLGLKQDERSWNEFWIGDTCFAIWEPAQFQPQGNSIALLHFDDVGEARAELEAEGVDFQGETFDTGVCHMASFTDPDGNPLTLHRRYAPYSDGSTP